MKDKRREHSHLGGTVCACTNAHFNPLHNHERLNETQDNQKDRARLSHRSPPKKERHSNCPKLEDKQEAMSRAAGPSTGQGLEMFWLPGLKKRSYQNPVIETRDPAKYLTMYKKPL